MNRATVWPQTKLAGPLLGVAVISPQCGPLAETAFYVSMVCEACRSPCCAGLWGHLVPPQHLLSVKSGPIHSGLLCLGIEAVFWNFAMKLEGHKTLHCLSCSSSVWCSLLGKERKLKKKKSSCMCESMCTRCGFSEDTSSNASVGSIFRYPFS